LEIIAIYILIDHFLGGINTIMKKAIAILFLGFFSYSCATFDFKVAEIKDFPSDMIDPAAITQEKYPDESGVIIYHKNEYHVEKVEGGFVFVKVRARSVEKIFSAKTYTRENHLFMDSYGSLTFVSGRIVRKNGNILHLPEKDLFEQTKELQYLGEKKKEKSVLFSDIKTEDGDIVEKEFEFYIKKPFSYEVALTIDSNIPVLQRIVSITIPEKMQDKNNTEWFFKHHYINGGSSAVETTENGFKKIVLKELNLKANDSEMLTEFRNENRKMLFFSVNTFKSWDDAAEKYYAKYIVPSLKISDRTEIKDLASKLTLNAKNDNEKIIKIVRFIKDIENDSLKNRYGNIYFVLPPSVTAKTLRAAMIDKALLLQELLSVSGLKSELIFINERSGNRLNKEFPALLYFNSMIVRVSNPEKPGEWISLDPDNKDYHELFLSHTYCDTYGLRIGEKIKDGLFITPHYDFDNTPELTEIINIKMISLEKASFEGEVTAKKMFFANFSKLDNLNRKRALESLSDFLFRNNSFIDMKSIQTSYHDEGTTVKVKFSGEMTMQIIKKDNRFTLIPNMLQTSFFAPLFKASEKRTRPIFLGRKRIVVSDWTVTLPDGYRFENNSDSEETKSVADVLYNKVKIFQADKIFRTVQETIYSSSFIEPDKEKEYANYLYNLYSFSKYIDFQKESLNEKE